VLWTILSVLIIIFLSVADALIFGSGRHQNLNQGDVILIVIYAIFLAVLNALGYYLWDIVKSAYKQIKEENENVQPAGNYRMNTYEKSSPAQYNHRV